MEQGVYVLSVTPERSQRKSGSSGSRVRLNPQPYFGPLPWPAAQEGQAGKTRAHQSHAGRHRDRRGGGRHADESRAGEEAMNARACPVPEPCALRSSLPQARMARTRIALRFLTTRALLDRRQGGDRYWASAGRDRRNCHRGQSAIVADRVLGDSVIDVIHGVGVAP